MLEALWLKTKDDGYYRLYRFWVKIFAVHFAVGVVSGITLEFEFGTNFARFSQAVANVLGPLFAYEGMTAFFLEAGFLGIMLFGWKRVPPVIHFLATCLVAIGATLSAFWIMAANSWMQTPAGYEIADGSFMVTSFREVIFNPAFITHLIHMIMASYETAAFAVAGISAYFLLKNEHPAFYKRSLALSLIMAALVAPLQILAGDLKGQNMAQHQPAKLAAVEAHWDTNHSGGAPFIVFAIPDMNREENRLEIAIPNFLSLLITHSMEGRIPGLKEFPKEDRPNSPTIFWSFRFMAGIGFLFFFIMAWAGILWHKKRLFTSIPFLKTLVVIQPLGFIATEMGWITTEFGRQPWVVYELMRTSEGISPIAPGNVIWSLILFMFFFVLIGGSYFYYTLKILRQGPDLDSPIPPVQLATGMPSHGKSSVGREAY